MVEISPEAFVDPAETDAHRLARRIWALRREALRKRFIRNGVSVSVWDPDEPFERSLVEVEAFRRQHARSRA